MILSHEKTGSNCEGPCKCPLSNSWIINEGNAIEIISVAYICKSARDSSSFAFNFNLDFLGQTVSYHPNYSKTSTYTSLDSPTAPVCKSNTDRPLILYIVLIDTSSIEPWKFYSFINDILSSFHWCHNSTPCFVILVLFPCLCKSDCLFHHLTKINIWFLLQYRTCSKGLRNLAPRNLKTSFLLPFDHLSG